MTEILVAEGYTIEELENNNDLVQPGESAEIRVFFDHDLSPDEIESIEIELLDRGVSLMGPITYGSRTMVIPFENGQVPGSGIGLLPLVPIVAIAGALGITSIVGWQIFKDDVTDMLKAPLGIPIWVWAIGGAGIVLLFLSRKGGKGKAGSAGSQVVQVFTGGK